MSETKGDHDAAATTSESVPAPPMATPPTQLPDLMAQGAKGAARPVDAGKTKTGPNLDAEALRAAEHALADGERALAAARAQLAAEKTAPVAKGSRGREVALRLLLAANVLAMLVVAMLPPAAARPAPVPVLVQPVPTPPVAPVESGPRLDDKYEQALAAAQKRDYPQAIRLLQDYLADSPRMAPSSQINVLIALEHYSAQVGNLEAAQDYRRRVEALRNSHFLPEDLVAMAKAAAASGDQESLRRVWARFLLQQRQVPSSLYKHVAEAYLQLGDSYRNQANEAAEKERVRQLEAAAASLREQAKGGEEKGK